MRHTRLLAAPALLLTALLLAIGGACGSSVSAKGHFEETLRPTNIEVRLISQSCFQGEIEPCG